MIKMKKTGLSEDYKKQSKEENRHSMEDFTSLKYGQTSFVNLKNTMELTNIDYFLVNMILMRADQRLPIYFKSLI